MVVKEVKSSPSLITILGKVETTKLAGIYLASFRGRFVSVYICNLKGASCHAAMRERIHGNPGYVAAAPRGIDSLFPCNGNAAGGGGAAGIASSAGVISSTSCRVVSWGGYRRLQFIVGGGFFPHHPTTPPPRHGQVAPKPPSTTPSP